MPLGVEPTAGQDPLHPRARHARQGNDAAAGEGGEVARHTEHGGRERPQATARPDGRRRGGRVAQVVAQADLADEVDRLRPPVEQ